MHFGDTPTLTSVLIMGQIVIERVRRGKRLGDHPARPDGTGPDAPVAPDSDRTWAEMVELTRAWSKASDPHTPWVTILRRKLFKAFAKDDPRELRDQLVEVGAVIVEWIEAIDAQTGQKVEP